MNILHLLTRKPDRFLDRVIEEHKKNCEVKLIDLRDNKDFDKIIDSIVSADRVISW